MTNVKIQMPKECQNPNNRENDKCKGELFDI